MGKSFLRGEGVMKVKQMFSVVVILLVTSFCQAADMSAEILSSVEYQQKKFLESAQVELLANCFLNPACFGQEMIDKSAGVFSLNGGGTISAIHKEGSGDTLFLMTCHHYTPPLKEGDITDFVILPDHYSPICVDSEPVYKKRITVITQAVSVSPWNENDQVIYKVLYMYGNENFIEPIIDYGFVLNRELPAGYPGLVFGCPKDGNLNIMRVAFGKVSLDLDPTDYKLVVNPGDGTFGSGSSGSFLLDKSLRSHGLIYTKNAGDCVTKPTNGIFVRLSANYNKLRNFFKADSAMPRFRNLTVRYKWPIAAWFESVKVQNDYNHIKLTWKTGWQLPDTTSFEIEVAYNNYNFVRVATVASNKAGVYTWQDTLDFNATAKYRIKAVNSWRYNTSDIVQTDVYVPVETNVAKDNYRPAGFSLQQNYPNPFNPTTTIAFSLKQTAPVTLTIVDLQGQMVRSLINHTMANGKHSVVWDGRDDSGNQLPSGVYFYQLQADGFSQTKKMILTK